MPSGKMIRIMLLFVYPLILLFLLLLKDKVNNVVKQLSQQQIVFTNMWMVNKSQ